MKIKRICSIAVLLTIMTLFIQGIYGSYRTEMENVTVVTTIRGKGDHFMYTYLRVIVPEGVYHGSKTMRAILWYTKGLFGRQNWVIITVYDNMDCLKDGESYDSHTFGEKNR